MEEIEILHHGKCHERVVAFRQATGELAVLEAGCLLGIWLDKLHKVGAFQQLFGTLRLTALQLAPHVH